MMTCVSMDSSHTEPYRGLEPEFENNNNLLSPYSTRNCICVVMEKPGQTT